jgi:hypothetical protein
VGYALAAGATVARAHFAGGYLAKAAINVSLIELWESACANRGCRCGGFAVIVLRRGQSRANGDFAVNMNLLTSAAAAVRDGKYSMAYVAQVKQQTVLRTETVETVIKNIGDAEARDGVFGPYFWLDEHFMPVGFNRSVSPYDPIVF